MLNSRKEGHVTLHLVDDILYVVVKTSEKYSKTPSGANIEVTPGALPNLPTHRVGLQRWGKRRG